MSSPTPTSCPHPRNLRGLPHCSCPWGEVAGSLSLSLSCSPSPALWATRPLITLGRRYRLGSGLLPKPAGLLHADGWQPAPFDKLIRPNLSMAAQPMTLPQICLLLPSCSPPTPKPLELWALPGSSWTPGSWKRGALHQGPGQEVRVRHPSRCSQTGAPLQGSPPHWPRRRRGPEGVVRPSILDLLGTY